jgi:hypothetical protein
MPIGAAKKITSMLLGSAINSFEALLHLQKKEPWECHTDLRRFHVNVSQGRTKLMGRLHHAAKGT